MLRLLKVFVRHLPGHSNGDVECISATVNLIVGGIKTLMIGLSGEVFPDVNPGIDQ